MKKALSLILSAIIILSAVCPLSVCATVAYAASYVSENKEFKVTTTKDITRPTVLKKGAEYTLRGAVKSDSVIAKVVFKVEDLDRFKNEIYVVRYPDKRSVKLGDYASSLNFAKLSSGVKRLTITFFDEDENKAEVMRDFTVLGCAKEPVHITGKCKITANKGKVANVTDASNETFWQSGTMVITFPKGKEVDGILIKWHKLDNDYTLESYDEDGCVLDEYDSDCFRYLHRYFEMSEGAVKAVIKLKNAPDNNGIASLRVYEKGRVGVSVEKWTAPKQGKCDLMVVSAHRDDELLFFGGTIPYYSGVKGKNVYTVFVSGADKVRHREVLASQWSMGIKTSPIFMNFPGGYHDGIKGTLRDFGGENKVVGDLVELIRYYQPDVIVSHDVNGEYGHPTHKTVAYAIKKAVKAAGDKNKYKSSADEYGAWKVKKLYLHLYGKNKIVMNYKKPSEKLGYKTPYQVACIGYDKYYSQHKSWYMTAPKVTKYPSNRYGLVYTRVGKDKKKNDLFEHIEEK
ncbi:MAG: PIG-L family deacetylase [Eubacterium sp.]|nr:PIG-L family deacetylase [Eubacterium sp.]